MKNQKKRTVFFGERAKKEAADQRMLDGPFGVLAALRQRMTGQSTESEQERHGDASEKASSQHAPTVTHREPPKPEKKKKFKASRKKPEQAFRVPLSMQPSLDPSLFDNGLRPESHSHKARSWKECADEVEAWLGARSGSAGVSNPEYPDRVAAKIERNIKDRSAAGSIDAYPGNEDTEVILGIDFGTTSTKIVAGFPYRAGEPTYALPAPEGAKLPR